MCLAAWLILILQLIRGQGVDFELGIWAGDHKPSPKSLVTVYLAGPRICNNSLEAMHIWDRRVVLKEFQSEN